MAEPIAPASFAPPFALDVAALELAPAELAEGQVLDGSPAIAERALWTSRDGRHEVGVWEITPGVVTDVEVDEVFVVLSGRAVVEVHGGPTLELAPGVAGGFAAGDRTLWRVSETVRKVYTITIG